ncbi:MAG: HPr family phosphocarrier protein [Candidatus Omnitrophica bacterium]|nr:HPr family phosphocarrier protein [Candidatus Omnitrophota bacterium]
MTNPIQKIEKKVRILNETGLHARPAAIFVQVANKFNSEISVKKGKQTVNGKSIMGILMLAAGLGQQVTICAEGVDAQLAVEELEKLLLNNEQ